MVKVLLFMKPETNTKEVGNSIKNMGMVFLNGEAKHIMVNGKTINLMDLVYIHGQNLMLKINIKETGNLKIIKILRIF